MEKYLIYLLAGLLGVIAHCLFKAKDLITDAEKLNVKFTFKDYLRVDCLCCCYHYSSFLNGSINSEFHFFLKFPFFFSIISSLLYSLSNDDFIIK